MRPLWWSGTFACALAFSACTSDPSQDISAPDSSAAITTAPSVPSTTVTSTTVASTTVPRTEPRVVTSSAESCVFEYNRATLAERSWAFDGIVQSVGTVEDSHLGTVPSATFAVNRWFHGGAAPQ